MTSWYPFACLKKRWGWQTANGTFFLTNLSLIFLWGVRSPTSVVVQLGYSKVIALLKSEFSLATVLQSGCILAVVLLLSFCTLASDWLPSHSHFTAVLLSCWLLGSDLLQSCVCLTAALLDTVWLHFCNFFCPTAMWLQTCFGISYVLSCSSPAVSLQSCINLAPVLFSGHDIYLSAT